MYLAGLIAQRDLLAQRYELETHDESLYIYTQRPIASASRRQQDDQGHNKDPSSSPSTIPLAPLD